MAKNIQEYVANSIIKYAKERDEEVIKLKNEIERLHGGIKFLPSCVKECCGCKKYIIEDEELHCFTCDKIYVCDECDDELYGQCLALAGQFNAIWRCNKCIFEDITS